MSASSERVPLSYKPVMTIAPMIRLPREYPIITTLTARDLAKLFPTLHIYMVPSNPLVALLPEGCVTRRGIEEALRWKERSIKHPEDEVCVEADLGEFIEIYQALTFLGNSTDASVVQTLDSHIRAELDDVLNLPDIKAVWALRYLPFTEPFITLLLTNLALFCRRTLARMDQISAAGRIDGDPDVLAQMESDVQILRWVQTEEEVFQKVEHMDEKLRKEADRCAAKKKRKQSAFRASLDVIQEETDESQKVMYEPAPGDW